MKPLFIEQITEFNRDLIKLKAKWDQKGQRITGELYLHGENEYQNHKVILK